MSSVAGLLVIACVFPVVGGFMDAYSYLAHDRVFANAQTGNVIFFGVYASAQDWPRALHALPPIAAFALGTAAARLLGVQSKKHTFRATLICQGLEGSVLFLLAIFATGLPNE